jgi:hypothetical protein
MIRKYAHYRILVINTHMGFALKGGIIRWCLKNFMRRANIMLFQEVSVKDDLPLLMRLLPPGWRLFPDDSRTSGTNYIAIKMGKRFSKATMVDVDARFGSKHGRSTRGVVVWDRQAGRWIVISCLHPDPLGRGFEHADMVARGRHIKQVKDTIQFHHVNSIESAIHISGGDVNEQMAPSTWMDLPNGLFDLSAGRMFEKAGMKQSARLAKNSTGPVRLMEVFITDDDDVKVQRSAREDTGVEGMDHEVLGVWLKVRRVPR